MRVGLRAVEISAVTPDVLDVVWESQIDMIERGLSHGQGDASSPEVVKNEVKQGNRQMWVIHEGTNTVGIVVLSAQQTSKMMKVFIDLIAGSRMDEWADQLEKLLIDFKDLIGADCIEGSCRPGLAKFLANRGWNKKAIIMELK